MTRARVDINPVSLQDLGDQIRALVLRTHRADSCIYTAGLTVAVLRKMGCDAFAMSVKAHIYAPDGHSIGIGYQPDDEPPRADAWPGHLVAICDRQFLCDFSLDQANRPEHGITMSTLVGPVDEAFLRGRKTLRCENAAGVIVEYLPVPGDRTYRDGPDWQRGVNAAVSFEDRSR